MSEYLRITREGSSVPVFVIAWRNVALLEVTNDGQDAENAQLDVVLTCGFSITIAPSREVLPTILEEYQDYLSRTAGKPSCGGKAMRPFQGVLRDPEVSQKFKSPDDFHC